MGALFSRKTTRQVQMEADLETTYSKLAVLTGASVSQLREWHHVFKKQYPRGMPEQQFIAENIDSHGGTRELWSRLFHIADEQGEGSISFIQYVSLLHKRYTNPAERRMKEVFRFFDRDGDGAVSEEELADALQEMFLLPEVGTLLSRNVEAGNITELEADDPHFRAKTIVARYDHNGDHVLTEYEFMECLRSDQAVAEALGWKKDMSE